MPLDKIVDELLTPKTKRAVGRSRARVAEYDADIAALVRKLPTASVSAGKDDSASVDAAADKLPEAGDLLLGSDSITRKYQIVLASLCQPIKTDMKT